MDGKVELLGWGLFSTAVAAAAMTYIGLPAGSIFLIAAVGLAAFVLIWVISQLQEGSTAHRRSTSAAGTFSREQPTTPVPVVSPAPAVAMSSPAVSTSSAVANRPKTPARPPELPAIARSIHAGSAATALDSSRASVGEPAPAKTPAPALAENRLRRAPATRREARASAQFGSARFSGVGHDRARPHAKPLRESTANPSAAVGAGVAPVRAAVAPAAPALKAARAYETSPRASSWTKTFGAPDTGSIPIQPYAERGSQNDVATVERPRGRHQMSHSRL